MEYKDLDVWKKSRLLNKSIYSITKSFPKEELYGLTSQIRRSSVSISSNIAEGCGRNTPKDSLRFLYISRGSLFELESQVYVSFDLEYISSQEFNNILKLIVDCKKVLNGFINYYKKLI